MTESESMANEPLTKLQPKTVGRFKVIYATLDNATEDEDGIHNPKLYISRGMLAPTTHRPKRERQRRRQPE